MAYVRKIVNLWSDPCNAEMVHPPYAGTTTGYLMRSVDIYQPIITIPAGAANLGATVPMDLIYQWTPSNYSSTTGFVTAGQISGSTFPAFSSMGGSSFVVNSTNVRGFRPVASCVEWVPTGPIGTRSGAVHFISSTSTTFSAGSQPATNVSEYIPLAQVTKPNAADTYEIKWLPTSLDEELETKAELSHSGCGTVTIMLHRVDGVAFGSATSVTLNGYFRTTTVWEWTPTHVGGIIPDIRAPPGFNTQQILSKVNVERIAHGFGRGVATAGLGFLANAMSRRRAGPTFRIRDEL